jgi:hypothetical protein
MTNVDFDKSNELIKRIHTCLKGELELLPVETLVALVKVIDNIVKRIEFESEYGWINHDIAIKLLNTLREDNEYIKQN